VTRIEAAELAMLSVEDLASLLEPALLRLAAGEAQLFPAAGAAVGSIAEGIQFLGRDQEIRRAVDLLKGGHRLEILAPRRSGKTSLMRRLEGSLPESWKVVFVNLEKELTLEDLAARFWVRATGEVLGLPRSRLPKLFRSLEAVRIRTLDLQAPHLELRRVLLGTGLVPQTSDLDWLNEHVDLALPYPALRFLDFMASHLRARGSVDVSVMARLLEEFLDKTDAFREFESNLRRRGLQERGGLRALRSCLDRLAIADPGAEIPRAEIDECLKGTRRPEELFAWLVETFPVVEREDGGVSLASRLFRHWWRRQLADGGAA
jgi:hypothetical protein